MIVVMQNKIELNQYGKISEIKLENNIIFHWDYKVSIFFPSTIIMTCQCVELLLLAGRNARYSVSFCVTAELKKPLTEHALFSQHHVMG